MRYFIYALALALTITGCKKQPTIEDQTQALCLEKLNSRLTMFAKYDGWDLSKIKTSLSYDKQVPSKFEVLLTDFTIKNGFNADVRSVAVCEGELTKIGEDYTLPGLSALQLTVNGQAM